MEIFLIAVGITLALLSAGVLCLLWFILQALQGLNRELAGLRAGVQGLGRLTEALGAIGDDLEEGRQRVRGGLAMVRSMLGPWLAKFSANN